MTVVSLGSAMYGTLNPNVLAVPISGDHFGTVVLEKNVTMVNGVMQLDSKTADAIVALGVRSIRFPGGAEAANKDDPETDISNPIYISKIKAMIDFCSSKGIKLSLTIPDSSYKDGMSIAESNALTNFANSVMSHAQEKGVIIDSIQLGNELSGHWGTGASNSERLVEYARSCKPALDLLNGVLENYNDKPDLTVNVSGNYYGAMDAFFAELGASADFIDAFDLHGTDTLSSDWQDIFGSGVGSSYDKNLTYFYSKLADRYPGNFPELKVSAWAYANPTSKDDEEKDPGSTQDGANLKLAGTGVVQFHAFSQGGVTSATNWLAAATNDSSLTLDDGSLSAGGAVFKLMRESLIGHVAVDVLQDNPNTVAYDPSVLSYYDQRTLPVLTRAFESNTDGVLFMIERTGVAQDIAVDVRDMAESMEAFIGGVASADVTILGVDGSPIAQTSHVTYEQLTLTRAQLIGAGVDFRLDPYEIARIVLKPGGVFGTQNADAMIGTANADAISGLVGNDTIYGNAGDDKLSGGWGVDQLFGGLGNDTLYGGEGGDSLAGNDGSDWVSYMFANRGLTASLTNPNSNSVDAWGDAYISIENIEGSNFDDILTGLNSGAAADNHLKGGHGNDTLDGLGGNDTLEGGTGADKLVGGAGYDIVTYVRSETAVIVDVMGITNQFGDATGDTFYDIEAVGGSAYNDYLRGSGGNDHLLGNDGDDMLLGRAGADRLTGGNGRDRAQYSDATSQVVVDLLVSSNNTGDAAGDIFSSIEDIEGSQYNDSLSGDAAANTIFAGAGNDTIGGRAGNDSLHGGGGQDMFVFVKNNDIDRVYDFQDDIDTIHLSGLNITSFAAARAFATEANGDVLFDFGGGDQLLIYNTTLSALSNDVVFS